jgi:hypothetical protein
MRNECECVRIHRYNAATYSSPYGVDMLVSQLA